MMPKKQSTMTPVTYTAPNLQDLFKESAAAIGKTDFAEFLNERLLVPESSALGLAAGPMEPAPDMAPTPENLNRMFAPDYEVPDYGWTVLDGPTMHVRSRVDFPGATPEMFKWWFCWHAIEPSRYMLWYPHGHLSATVEDPKRLTDASLTLEERYYENRSEVVEYLGRFLLKSTIRFCDPSILGVDMNRYAAAGFQASASGLLELPGHPDITIGLMIHMVRPTSTGMELFSRYWIGAHPALARFPGADKGKELLAGAGMDDAEQLKLMAYELAVHDMSEFNNLARFLPALYQKYDGKL
ncbi:hypothetical protein ABHV46_01030 [Asaia sp. BMEF1]|uniref:DAPG hydrolase family protein n=1 Tax=Asaia sp. BMEF1 TaxID=3155932 RepID=UPI003F67DC23